MNWHSYHRAWIKEMQSQKKHFQAHIILTRAVVMRFRAL
jgi:hypothetical protein